MNASNVQLEVPIGFDMRFIQQFVDVMQSYKSQMKMVITGLDRPGRRFPLFKDAANLERKPA